jgi:hypothetical protein
MAIPNGNLYGLTTVTIQPEMACLSTMLVRKNGCVGCHESSNRLGTYRKRSKTSGLVIRRVDFLTIVADVRD